MKRKISLSNITTAALVVFSLLIFFSPDAKGWLIEGLMKIGLFQPDVKSTANEANSSLSGIVFKDGSGRMIDLSKQKGKVVFVNFWATWCPPCRAEMPSINKLYEQFKENKNVVFLMVDVDDNYEKAKKFMDKKNYILPVYTPASDIPENILDKSIPTTLIINKSGKIIFQHTGAGDYSSRKVSDFMNKLSTE